MLDVSRVVTLFGSSCASVWYFFSLHVRSYIYIRTLTDHRWSQFADSVHPLHIVTSYDIVTLGSALFLSLVAKREAMDTFDLEGRMCSLLLSVVVVVVVVVVDMEFYEVKRTVD